MSPNGGEPTLRRVGIVSKPGREDIPGLITDVVSWLGGRGIDVQYDLVTAEYLGRSTGFDREKLPPGLDLLIVLGGDGTLLSAARGVGRSQTPILAVNLGGLGFMMTTGPDELLPQLERVAAGDYTTSCRSVRVDCLFAVSGRPRDLSFGFGDLSHADLPAYADEPAAGSAGRRNDRSSHSRRR